MNEQFSITNFQMFPKINNFVRKRVEILEYTKLTEDVFEISFEKPEGFTHVPGQFVSIIVPQENKQFVFRAYSVMHDKKGNVQICVKRVKDGVGSNYLYERKKGDKLSIIYPLGYFGLPDKLEDNLCFVATGTGIVPIISILESLQNVYKGSVRVIFGLRYEADIFYEERLKNLQNKFSKCSNTITVSRPDNTYKGKTGRVTNYLDFETKHTQFFMCGSGAMIREVREILKDRTVDKKDVFFENFNE